VTQVKTIRDLISREYPEKVKSIRGDSGMHEKVLDTFDFRQLRQYLEKLRGNEVFGVLRGLGKNFRVDMMSGEYFGLMQHRHQLEPKEIKALFEKMTKDGITDRQLNDLDLLKIKQQHFSVQPQS